MAPNRCLLKPDCTRFISWDHWDQNLRISSLDTGKSLLVVDSYHDDAILCCAVSSDGSIVATGGTSSVVKIWEVSKDKKLELKLKAVLDGHVDSVTTLSVCREFSLIASGGGDGDRSCILWDLNTLSYVQSLENQPGPMVAVCVSTNNGDLITVADVAHDQEREDIASLVTLWNVNGFKVASYESPEKVNCVAMSSAMEGVNVNVIIGGLESGAVMVWSAWDLSSVRKVCDSATPIISITLRSVFCCHYSLSPFFNDQCLTLHFNH